jgi:hypothetical protein
MTHVSLVIPYYDNPGMLAIHYKHWASLVDDIKVKIDVIIVDDGSPHSSAYNVHRPCDLPELTIYRVLVDKPWHQHAARNIGAHVAKGPWLLMTDMDHLVPITTWQKVLKLSDCTKVYTFSRIDAPDLLPKRHPRTGLPHPHPNSFVIAKKLYWEVGGYDEDYCGFYGSDGLFRSRLFSAAEEIPLKVPLIRFPSEVQYDASTRNLPRKEGRDPNIRKNIRLKKFFDNLPPKVLSMPYRKLYP